jgi:hypothetical protein
MTIKKNRRAWDKVRSHLAADRSLTSLSIPRRKGFPHPRDAGARLTTTWPVGQTADYLLEGPPGEASLAVREFEDRFEVFLDTARLAANIIKAIEREPKKAMYVGSALVGGALGASISNKREGVLLGVGIGLLVAALIDKDRE